MDDLINQLVSKTGISKEQAQQVVNFLKEHASEIPKWLGQAGIADKLPGGLGDKLGGMFGDKKD